MDKKFKNLTWHYDASHAWLQVSLKQLESLKIKEKISPFSYYTHNKKSEYTGYAFLEEDCDAFILINAMGGLQMRCGFLCCEEGNIKTVDHGLKADRIHCLNSFPRNANSSRVSFFNFFEAN